ncbi:MAG: hypothetical protein WAM82_00770 [Thermoanaerobaculia bacterium]
MEPGTVAAITAAFAAAKTGLGTVRELLAKGKGAREALRLVDDLQARVFELQEIAFRLHQEKAEAIEKNGQLREEIRRKEEGAADRKKYYLKKVGQATVLACDETPDIYYCPNCFRLHGKALPVQPHSQHIQVMHASHWCPNCKAHFRL